MKQEKKQILVVYSIIGLATLFAFAASSVIGSTSIAIFGFGIVAFIFGLRHGLDADHIAAIDSTTRKLMQQGKRPLTVGTWFSLGHSTVVAALVVALVLSTRSIIEYLPILRSEGALFGTALSASVLTLLGLMNVGIAYGIYKLYKEMKGNTLDAQELAGLLDKRGFMNRLLSPLFKVVEKSWQAYPMGILFGLGFDTASEIALIGVSVGLAITSTNIPMWAILILPLLFGCGMVLVDTTDGIIMRMAYGWSALNPLRKIYYNLTLTVTTVLITFIIGGVELFQIVSTELKLEGPFWTWLNGIDFESLGYGVIAVFVCAGIVAMIAFRRVEKASSIDSTPRVSIRET